MAKYKVTLFCEVSKTYEVESDSPENAMEEAYKMDIDVPIDEYHFVGDDGFEVQDETGDILLEE